MTLSSQQQTALYAIAAFLRDTESHVFILRGYAGTGKTTLIRHIPPMAADAGKRCILMAPTGRAAKMLKTRTGIKAHTIHKRIYAFSRLVATQEGVEETPESSWSSKKADDLQLYFKLVTLKDDTHPEQHVFVVDEASMVGSRLQVGELLRFGTGVLLDDLLTFVRPHLGGKVIFVGDPAQLPPVGENYSAALDEDYFKKKGLNVRVAELTEVVRQKAGSAILQNATKVRDLLLSEQKNELDFERKDGEVADTTPAEAIALFHDLCPVPEISKTVIIAYSNALVKSYNDALRKRYYPEASHVMPGDVLQVVKNTICPDLGDALFNGDFVKVMEVTEETESQAAPVMMDVNGERKRVRVQLEFRDVTLLNEEGRVFHSKIIDTLLSSPERNLNHAQTVALYINFIMRHPGLKPSDPIFKEELKNDPYFNAIHVKYGYAITAHKAQGCEWETVFVDYSGQTALKEMPLRWSYTATTRASRTLYGVNMPHITPLSALKMVPILRCTKPTKDAFSFAEVETDLLPRSASAAQKCKCVCSKANLERHGLQLLHVKMLQYVDRYTIGTLDGEEQYDCQYNGAGLYTDYRPLKAYPDADFVVSLLADESEMVYAMDYTPATLPLARLYASMKSLCDELHIAITNIVEKQAQYSVVYHLKTSGRFSQITFYFNNTGAITYGQPQSDMGAEDILLAALVDKLNQKKHVSA